MWPADGEMILETAKRSVRVALAMGSTHKTLIDGHGRRIHHLRLSVTSACDLHCIYCKPRSDGAGGRKLIDRQRVEFVQFLYEQYGLTQVRITGGEPLLCPSVEELIQGLRAHAPGILLAMTTNGQRLANRAVALRRVGLDRLNISLDSLNADQYRALTGGELAPVIAGLDAAFDAGFPPPKLNAVVLRGHNVHEVCDLAAWAFARGCEVRFLEAMPIGPAAEVNRRLFVAADEIKQRLRQEFVLRALPVEYGETALRFMADGPRGRGTLGLIAPMTKPFCGSCGRVRLTSEGKLFPCLLDERFADMRPAWTDNGFDPEVADRLITEVVQGKRAQGPKRQSTAMVSLGG